MGINENKKLFVWGDNKKGQLGIDPNSYSWIKNPTISNHNIRIQDISFGKQHSLILTHDYKV